MDFNPCVECLLQTTFHSIKLSVLFEWIPKTEPNTAGTTEHWFLGSFEIPFLICYVARIRNLRYFSCGEKQLWVFEQFSGSLVSGSFRCRPLVAARPSPTPRHGWAAKHEILIGLDIVLLNVEHNL